MSPIPGGSGSPAMSPIPGGRSSPAWAGSPSGKRRHYSTHRGRVIVKAKKGIPVQI